MTKRAVVTKRAATTLFISDQRLSSANYLPGLLNFSLYSKLKKIVLLQRVLEQLDESKDQKEQSNIDEEADLIQNERVLDLGDNKEFLAGFARKSSR